MKNWLKRFNDWSNLTFSDKFLFIKLGYTLMFISFLNKVLPFKTFRNLYKYLLTFESKIPDLSKKRKSIEFIKKWSGFLKITCLPQALTVKYIFRALPNTQLIIGVNKNSEEFNAHAWVEENGAYLIGDRPFEQYTPLWIWK